MSDTMVLYYSHTKLPNRGCTMIAAEMIQHALESDMFRIEADESNINTSWYINKKTVKKLSKIRPELIAYLDDLDGYKNVILCSPCWWGTFPPTVFSQLDILSFKKKRVSCLITHEGSCPDGCIKNMRQYCKGAEFVDFILVHKDELSRMYMRIAKWAKDCVS